MARSVNYQSDAVLIKYTHFEPVYGEFNPETGDYEGDNFNEFETQEAFGNFVCGLVDALKQRFPSLEDVPPFRECSGTDAPERMRCSGVCRTGNVPQYCATETARYFWPNTAA